MTTHASEGYPAKVITLLLFSYYRFRQLKKDIE